MPAKVTRQYGRANFVKPGTNNVICDRTGFKMKASDCRLEWNGLFVRKKSWERRQPQDLIRGFPDHQQPAFSRPGQADVFITPVSGQTSWDNNLTSWDAGNTIWDH